MADEKPTNERPLQAEQPGAQPPPPAGGDTPELIDLYKQLAANRRAQSLFRTILTVLILAVVVVYGWLAATMVKTFDDDYFLDALMRRMDTVTPVAVETARQVFDDNRDELMDRLEATVSENAPTFQARAEAQMDLLVEDMSVLLAERFRAFIDRQYAKHGERIFALYPELDDPEQRERIMAHIDEVVAGAVDLAMTEELAAVERTLEDMQDTFFLPEVRAQVAEVRNDPDHRAELSRRFMNILARPLIEP